MSQLNPNNTNTANTTGAGPAAPAAAMSQRYNPNRISRGESGRGLLAGGSSSEESHGRYSVSPLKYCSPGPLSFCDGNCDRPPDSYRFFSTLLFYLLLASCSISLRVTGLGYATAARLLPVLCDVVVCHSCISAFYPFESSLGKRCSFLLPTYTFCPRSLPPLPSLPSAISFRI